MGSNKTLANRFLVLAKLVSTKEQANNQRCKCHCLVCCRATRPDWDEYFIQIAQVISTRSKDISSKIGAVLVKDRHVIATGYNGLPIGINDDIPERQQNRFLKYSFTVHAEMNCLLQAAKLGVATEGTTLYLYAFGPPIIPCTECAKAVIQAGITRIVGFAAKKIEEHWVANFAFSKALLTEAGVAIEECNQEERDP